VRKYLEVCLFFTSETISLTSEIIISLYFTGKNVVKYNKLHNYIHVYVYFCLGRLVKKLRVNAKLSIYIAKVWSISVYGTGIEAESYC